MNSEQIQKAIKAVIASETKLFSMTEGKQKMLGKVVKTDEQSFQLETPIYFIINEEGKEDQKKIPGYPIYHWHNITNFKRVEQ